MKLLSDEDIEKISSDVMARWSVQDLESRPRHISYAFVQAGAKAQARLIREETLKEVGEWLQKQGRLAVHIPIDETTPVQWVGCYTTRWGKLDEPTEGFYSLEGVDSLLNGQMPE